MHTTRTLFLLVAGSLLGFLPPREPVPSHTEAAPPAVTPMPKITTALWFAKEAEAAVHYYVSVFADGKILDETRWPEGSVGPKGSLISATFRVAGMELIAINGNPESHFNDSMSLLVQCDTQQEIDHYWQKLSADGKGQCGWTKDKFGVTIGETGRAKTLEDQAKGPIANPIEMDQDPKLLITELRAIPEYTRRFDEAFRGSGGSAVTLDNIASAIAAFERSIATVNSPFDRYAAGDRSAMNDSAVRGLNLFRSVSTRCFECHEIPTFAMKEYKVLGVPSSGDPTKLDDDRGRAAISPGASVERAFRVPTLRNVAKTGPYMHNGSLKTLGDVLDFYSQGGGAGRGYPLSNVDDKIRKFDMTPDEKADLISFMEALTDESLRPEIPAKVPSGLPVPQGPL